MGKTIQAKWQNWEGNSTETLSLKEYEKGIFVKSTVNSKGEADFSLTYEIKCDKLWRVTMFRIESSEAGKKLELIPDGFGNWSNNSDIISQLKGAIDVDITATPFTNTLPIRRLKLAEGQSAEIKVVYITAPALEVSLAPQKYTCIIPDKRYRFESLDSDFAREIEVDAYGLVLEYPGLFKRVL